MIPFHVTNSIQISYDIKQDYILFFGPLLCNPINPTQFKQGSHDNYKLLFKIISINIDGQALLLADLDIQTPDGRSDVAQFHVTSRRGLLQAIQSKLPFYHTVAYFVVAPLLMDNKY